jgi:hypothetical protein
MIRIVIMTIVFLFASSLLWAPLQEDGEWRFYGGDLFSCPVSSR